MEKTTERKTRKKNEPFVIVRTRDAGVHAGYLVSREAGEVALRDSRRLWLWVAAKTSGQLATLSEVAVYGVNSKDPRSRIAVKLPSVTIIGACEVIECSEVSRQSIESAP